MKCIYCDSDYVKCVDFKDYSYDIYLCEKCGRLFGKLCGGGIIDDYDDNL